MENVNLRNIKLNGSPASGLKLVVSDYNTNIEINNIHQTEILLRDYDNEQYLGEILELASNPGEPLDDLKDKLDRKKPEGPRPPEDETDKPVATGIDLLFNDPAKTAGQKIGLDEGMTQKIIDWLAKKDKVTNLDVAIEFKIQLDKATRLIDTVEKSMLLFKVDEKTEYIETLRAKNEIVPNGNKDGDIELILIALSECEELTVFDIMHSNGLDNIKRVKKLMRKVSKLSPDIIYGSKPVKVQYYEKKSYKDVLFNA